VNKVLVLAVHPDDETFGCGGTLLKHKENGDEVFWLIATRMEEGSCFSKERIELREREIETVAKMYHFDGIDNLEIPATRVSELSTNGLIDRIAKIFNRIKPNIVYLPFIGDVHSDHRIMLEAAYSCTKTFRYPFVKKILMMETISETEFAPSLAQFAFTPNYFVDISEFLDRKLDIVKVYENELGEHPFPRNLGNITALATFRGAMSGCRYAESFMISKEIW